MNPAKYLREKLSLKKVIPSAMLLMGVGHAGAQELKTHYGVTDIVGCTVDKDGKLGFWNDAILSAGANFQAENGAFGGIEGMVLVMTDKTGKTTPSLSQFMAKLGAETKGWKFTMQFGRQNAGGDIVFNKSGDIYSDERNYEYLLPGERATIVAEKDGFAFEVGVMSMVNDNTFCIIPDKNANAFAQASIKAMQAFGMKLSFSTSLEAGKNKTQIVSKATVENDKGTGVKAMAIWDKNEGLKMTAGAFTTVKDHLLMLDASYNNNTKQGMFGVAYELNDAIQLLGIVNYGEQSKNVEIGISKRISWHKNKTTNLKEQKRKNRLASLGR